MTSLLVNEIFGPTFQGEGPSMGKQAMFLRLAMCNLKCSWCDTKYTWDFASGNYDKRDEIHVMQPDALWAKLRQHDTDNRLLVITGGEPMLQQRNLLDLIDMGLWLGPIEIETNGTVAPLPGWDKYDDISFNISPKLQHAGNGVWPLKYADALVQYKPGLLWSLNVRFKFVVQQLSDLDEVHEFVWINDIPQANVWIMPEGTDAATLNARAQSLSDEVLKRGWNMTTRMHVLLWGNERKR